MQEIEKAGYGIATVLVSDQIKNNYGELHEKLARKQTTRKQSANHALGRIFMDKLGIQKMGHLQDEEREQLKKELKNIKEPFIS